MATDQLAASLSFLTDAAHLLRGTAPETSAHLMRHRADMLLHANLSQHELQRQHVCSACGHIMLPGRGTTVRLRTRKSRKRAKASQGPTAGRPDKIKVLTCDRCRRLTRVSLPAPEPAGRGKSARGRWMPTTSTTTKAEAKTTAPPAEAPKKSANASSKKRAKDRKSGLQALLSRQQNPSSSLTLADFMGK